MTDQLETDLRTLLAERAAEITVEPVAGEQLIAQRLDAGECASATVVPLGRRRDRTRWRPAAAAFACFAVLAAALALRDRDDAEVSTQPPTTLLPFGAEGSRLTLLGVDEVVDCSVLDHAVEAAFLTLPSGECVRMGDPVRGDLVIESATAVPTVADPGPHDLWNVEVSFSDSGRSLTRGLAERCAQRDDGCEDGRVVVLIDDGLEDVLRPTGASFFEGDRLRLPADVPEVVALTLARDLTASIGNPPPDVTVEEPVDHLLGEPGDAAKDVAERAMAELLGDPSITTSATDAGDGCTR